MNAQPHLRVLQDCQEHWANLEPTCLLIVLLAACAAVRSGKRKKVPGNGLRKSQPHMA